MLSIHDKNPQHSPGVSGSLWAGCPRICCLPKSSPGNSRGSVGGKLVKKGSQQLLGQCDPQCGISSFAWRFMKVMDKLNAQLGAPSRHQGTGHRVGRTARVGMIRRPLQSKNDDSQIPFWEATLYRHLGKKVKETENIINRGCLGCNYGSNVFWLFLYFWDLLVCFWDRVSL